MQDSSVVGATAGTTIASSSYNASSWYTATVPGTVLSTLVDNGIYPDPNYGENMLSIPDLANLQKRYWYYSTFTVSAAAGQRVWLQIEGINYQAYIFLNGQSVGTMLGAFLGAKFDITSMVNLSGANYLAIKIRGNYNPGTYHSKQSGSCGLNGGTMTQDGPSFIATQGWDWIPTIPDRSMGIWKPVYIKVTGPVAIRSPWIRTTNVSASSATVPLQVTLVNPTSAAVTGTLNADIDGTIQFQATTVTVPANGSATGAFPTLTITNPRLWWPNGYGDPNLYTCNISFTPSGGTVSDTTTFAFGVRQFSYSTTNSLTISCNGKRILVKGGNWGMDDGMKRWDLHKTENKVRYHREMNFNMLRDWLGMTDNEPFYQFCDRYGIMVWSDFWQAYGPSDGPEPNDITLFENNLLDKILRTRNHPSIAIWCSRNETTPNATLLAYLQNAHSMYDGTRRVQPSSGSDGSHSGGPYTWTNISDVYNQISGFHSEFGSPTVPSSESMAAFLPSANQMPLGNTWWAWHDYCSGNGYPVNYTNAMTSMWGAPSTLADCCKKAQLMNYDEYRAAFEALAAKRFNGATGLLLWMSNCVWPSTMWQTYDYYMEGTGAMYGCMKGCEPVHVQFDTAASNNILVINNTASAISNYSVTAATYNLNGSKAWSNTGAVSVAADNTANAFTITPGTSTPYFLDLKLKDATGAVVSKNFYWLPTNGTSISGAVSMTQATIAQTATAVWSRSGQENTITVKLVNSSTVCAVACRLMLTRTTSGVRILPCHFNDNYFSLAPGDTQDVVAKFDEIDRNSETPKLCVSGLNVPQTCLTVGGVSVGRNDMVQEPQKSGMYVCFSGGRIRMNNVPSASVWKVKIIDMRGNVVFAGECAALGTTASLSTGRLPCGTYIAQASSAERMFRTLVVVTGR